MCPAIRFITTILRMTTTTSDPTPRQLCDFLAEYASCLFGSGATCIRLEKNVTRMAERAGMAGQLSILPRHIHVSVRDRAAGDCATQLVTTAERPVSFDINTRLSRLSWDYADGKIDFVGMMGRFREIVASPGSNPWAVLVLASLANAAFCRLFGGDFVAMAVVFVATLAGFSLKQTMAERHIDVRLIFVVCSFVSAVLAASDGLFGLGSTPDIALGTSILYLVPGIPFINSFSDMLDRHYICAFGRMMNAVMLTACLSIGLCCGMMLMKVGMF